MTLIESANTSAASYASYQSQAESTRAEPEVLAKTWPQWTWPESNAVIYETRSASPASSDGSSTVRASSPPPTSVRYAAQPAPGAANPPRRPPLPAPQPAPPAPSASSPAWTRDELRMLAAGPANAPSQEHGQSRQTDKERKWALEQPRHGRGATPGRAGRQGDREADALFIDFSKRARLYHSPSGPRAQPRRGHEEAAQTPVSLPRKAAKYRAN